MVFHYKYADIMTSSDKYNSRLEKLIRIWIYSVSFLSAFVNMTGVLAFGYSLSHYSGNYTTIFEDITHHAFQTALILIVLSISFVLGSVIASFVNADKDFRLESKYGEIQFVIGICLIIIYLFFYNEDHIIYFLSCVLGTQNGLIRSYRGMGFKTTHVTGTLTDLGTYIGYAIRGERNVVWKISFEIALLTAFGAGTLLSVLLFPVFGDRLFILASIGYILSGLIYFGLRCFYSKSNIQ